MEHLTFKGTTAYPSTRAISEAIEGVGGSFNAATDRESTVYWVRVPRREVDRAMDVIGELIVRPRLEDTDIQSERTVIIEEIRSYLDDPSEYCQILFQTAMFGDGPLGREICGDESDILALPEAAIRDFWKTAYRPATRSWRSSATCRTTNRSSSHRRRSGQATAWSRASPGARASGRTAGADRQARHEPGADLPRRAGPPARPSRQLDAGDPQRLSSATDEQPAFSVGREDLGLAYDVSSGLVDYADAGALEVSAGVDPAGCRPPLEAILVELARLRDELVPRRAGEGQALSRGGLELRMDDTRHVGRGSAGRKRSTTGPDLDEALAAVEAVDAPPSSDWPGSSSATTSCGSPPSPRRYLRGLEARLGCRMTTDPDPADTTPGRSAELVLAHAHLRLGRWRSPGRSSRRWPGWASSTRRARRPGRGPLADRRPGRRGEAAAVALRGDEEHRSRC
jgi:hypothetical protein